MSDSTQGEGWWQASDGKWYPPEQHPEFQAGATQPIESMPPPTAATPVPPPPPTAAMPVPPPPVAPGGPPPGAPAGPPPGAPGSGSSNAKWIIVGVLAVAAVAIAAFLLLGGDDDKKKVVASDSSSSSASTKSSSSSSSKSSSKSSSSTRSSSSSSSGVTHADIQKKMLTAKEVGPDFVDDTFTRDDTSPTFCGQPSLNQQVPPLRDVGSASSNGTAFFQEEALAYGSSADAQKVLDLIKSEANCPSPTVQGGGPIQFIGPIDVTDDMTTPVEEAIEIDFQTEEAQGQFIIIKDTVAIVIFQFVAPVGTDTNKLPDAIDVVNKGLKKIVS